MLALLSLRRVQRHGLLAALHVPPQPQAALQLERPSAQRSASRAAATAA
jgi:hypothetical protein